MRAADKSVRVISGVRSFSGFLQLLDALPVAAMQIRVVWLRLENVLAKLSEHLQTHIQETGVGVSRVRLSLIAHVNKRQSECRKIRLK